MCLARAPFNRKGTSLVPPLPLQLQHPQLEAGQRLPPHQARIPPCGTRRRLGGGGRQTRVLQCLSQSPLPYPRLASGRSRCSLMTFQVGWPHDEATHRTRHALHAACALVAPQAAGVREAATAQRAEAMLIKLGKVHEKAAPPHGDEMRIPQSMPRPSHPRGTTCSKKHSGANSARRHPADGLPPTFPPFTQGSACGAAISQFPPRAAPAAPSRPNLRPGHPAGPAADTRGGAPSPPSPCDAPRRPGGPGQPGRPGGPGRPAKQYKSKANSCVPDAPRAVVRSLRQQPPALPPRHDGTRSKRVRFLTCCVHRDTFSLPRGLLFCESASQQLPRRRLPEMCSNLERGLSGHVRLGMGKQHACDLAPPPPPPRPACCPSPKETTTTVPAAAAAAAGLQKNDERRHCIFIYFLLRHFCVAVCFVFVGLAWPALPRRWCKRNAEPCYIAVGVRQFLGSFGQNISFCLQTCLPPLQPLQPLRSPQRHNYRYSGHRRQLSLSPLPPLSSVAITVAHRRQPPLTAALLAAAYRHNYRRRRTPLKSNRELRYFNLVPSTPQFG
eukprot:gene17930-biopygen844